MHGSATIESCFHVGLAWNGTVDGRKDAKQLMEEFTDALYHVGPLSIAIDATLHDFYFYSAGFTTTPSAHLVWTIWTYCTSGRLWDFQKWGAIYNSQK